MPAPDGRHRGALILTHNRPELLQQCIEAIQHQVDLVLVIDNASSPPAEVPEHVRLLRLPDQPPVLSRWWNIGWDVLRGLVGHEPMDIATLCDDVYVPEGWFAAVTAAMRVAEAALGCSNPFGHQHPPRVKVQPDNNIAERCPGWAHIHDATKGLRADESMHWWRFDDDFDIGARLNGGMVMIGGYQTLNRQPNHYTNAIPALGEQAGRDAEAFKRKYNGWLPW